MSTEAKGELDKHPSRHGCEQQIFGHTSKNANGPRALEYPTREIAQRFSYDFGISPKIHRI